MVKKVLAGLLVLGVGIVWIPQLLSAKVDTKPVVAPEVPANGTSDLDGASSSTDGAESKGSTTSTTPTSDGEPAAANTNKTATADVGTANGAVAGEEPVVVQHEDLGASFDTALSRARKLLATPGGADHLPTETDGREEQHEPATAQVPSVGAVVNTADSDVILPSNLGSESGDTATEQDPIAAFLSTHPLQGTVIGASDRVATMGPLLVRVGDEPVRGLVVTTITSRYVEMRRDGGDAPGTIRVDLEPFRARAPSTTTGAAGSNGGGANAGGANTGNTTNSGGGADAGNVAAANAGLDRLLPQIQNANRALEDAAKAATGKNTGANTNTGTNTGTPSTNTTNGVGTTGAANATPKTTTGTGSNTNTSTNAGNGNKEPHGS